MRRKGWPVSERAPPSGADLAGRGWTNVLDQTLQGWEVVDVIQIFEEEDAFFRDWHDSLGDTCAPSQIPEPAQQPSHHASLATRMLTGSQKHWICAM